MMKQAISAPQKNSLRKNKNSHAKGVKVKLAKRVHGLRDSSILPDPAPVRHDRERTVTDTSVPESLLQFFRRHEHSIGYNDEAMLSAVVQELVRIEGLEQKEQTRALRSVLASKEQNDNLDSLR